MPQGIAAGEVRDVAELLGIDRAALVISSADRAFRAQHVDARVFRALCE